MGRYEARKAIVNDLRELGQLDKEEGTPIMWAYAIAAARMWSRWFLPSGLSG